MSKAVIEWLKNNPQEPGLYHIPKTSSAFGIGTHTGVAHAPEKKITVAGKEVVIPAGPKMMLETNTYGQACPTPCLVSGKYGLSLWMSGVGKTSGKRWFNFLEFVSELDAPAMAKPEDIFTSENRY